MGNTSISGTSADVPLTVSTKPLPTLWANQVSRSLPIGLVGFITTRRAAGDSDTVIADALEAAGVHHPAYYGYPESPSDPRWRAASVAALRAAQGIS